MMIWTLKDIIGVYFAGVVTIPVIVFVALIIRACVIDSKRRKP